VVSVLREINWPTYFLKDYVKSLKTAPGPIVQSAEDAPRHVAAMIEYRGEIEGGLSVRRVERFLPDSETRYFVLRGKPYAPGGQHPPNVVFQCAERIASPFYSVDVAIRDDGVERVVEIGDGQVSDLVGWTTGAFVRMWREE
jgi:hypothetical protein